MTLSRLFGCHKIPNITKTTQATQIVTIINEKKITRNHQILLSATIHIFLLLSLTPTITPLFRARLKTCLLLILSEIDVCSDRAFMGSEIFSRSFGAYQRNSLLLVSSRDLH